LRAGFVGTVSKPRKFQHRPRLFLFPNLIRSRFEILLQQCEVFVQLFPECFVLDRDVGPDLIVFVLVEEQKQLPKNCRMGCPLRRNEPMDGFGNTTLQPCLLLMKTTIDLPDELLHRAKVVAAQRKTTLKELVLSGLKQQIESPGEQADETEAFVAAFARGGNTENPVGKTHRHEIYDRPILHRL